MSTTIPSNCTKCGKEFTGQGNWTMPDGGHLCWACFSAIPLPDALDRVADALEDISVTMKGLLRLYLDSR